MTDAATKKTLRTCLPVRTAPYIFALYMAIIMAFLMSLVITLAEFGMGPHYRQM